VLMGAVVFGGVPVVMRRGLHEHDHDNERLTRELEA